MVFSFCFGEEEDLVHLFGECPISKLWWCKTCDWLQVDLPYLSDSIISCLQELEFSTKYTFKIERGWLFGLVLRWSIWVCRDAILFKGGMLSNFYGVGMIKLISWE